MVGADEGTGSVIAKFEDGSSATADILIGADGPLRGPRIDRELPMPLSSRGLRPRVVHESSCRRLGATTAAGGILVAVNHRLTSAEVGYILQHSGARYLLLDTSLEALAAPLDLDAVTVIRSASTGGPGDPYEEMLASASPARPVSWLEDEQETISINYTSGTTGKPKGVQYTYRGACLNALAEVIHAGMSADSVYLWTLPMFHCNGWCFPWAVTAVAARHVTMRTVDPGLAWELIDAEGVTHYNGAPTVQLMILNHPRSGR